MKPVPFVSNHLDNVHCVNAVFRMVHQYFFGSDLTWEEIDSLTKAVTGKATWTFMGEMEFAKKGLKVINIEPIDYQKLFQEGTGYLNRVVGPETAAYYFEKSNLSSVIQYIPEYLGIVKHETRRASFEEIISYIKQGCLIGAEVNSRILNHREGFSLHFILIYGHTDEGFIIHDPGNPPLESRQVSFSEVTKCFDFPGANGGVTIFGKKPYTNPGKKSILICSRATPIPFSTSS